MEPAAAYANHSATVSPQAIQRFSRFFRGYNVGLSLIVASIPVLIGVWNLIPLYDNTKNYLTLITSVGSYLIVGFIFSQRIAIGRFYFPGGGRTHENQIDARDISRGVTFGWLPLILAISALGCFYLYISLINASISRIAYDFTFTQDTKSSVSSGSSPASSPSKQIRVCDALSISPGESAQISGEFSAFGKDSPVTILCNRQLQQSNGKFLYDYSIILANQEVVDVILKQAPSAYIPLLFPISLSFLLSFLFATSAFILMGLREYIQEELKLRDETMISQAPRPQVDKSP